MQLGMKDNLEAKQAALQIKDIAWNEIENERAVTSCGDVLAVKLMEYSYFLFNIYNKHNPALLWPPDFDVGKKTF